MLLIEYETEFAAEAQRLARDLADRLLREEPAVLQTAVATGPEELELLWQLREAALPSLSALPGSTHPIAYIEDVGVPVDSLHEYMRRVQDILQEHETTASFLAMPAPGKCTRGRFSTCKSRQKQRGCGLSPKRSMRSRWNLGNGQQPARHRPGAHALGGAAIRRPVSDHASGQGHL